MSAALPSLPLPDHDRAVIVSTGDEIMTGQLQDSNARWLAEQLVGAGIIPIEHVAVGDALSDLVATLRRAVEKAPLVIMSGGLGPTDGDLTRPALCELLGDELVQDQHAAAALTELLLRRGRPVTERQMRQAQRPTASRCLDNTVGTAPGLHAAARTTAAHGQADVIALPGPPGELIPMFNRHVRPMLRTRPGQIVITRLLHVVGMAEADCVTRLGDLTRRDRTPLVGITASGGVLTIRIRCESEAGREQAEERVAHDEQQVRSALGDHLFATGAGTGLDMLSQTVLAKLIDRHETLATVESCTGGMLGQLITAVPGSSAAYRGGLVTYSNDLKLRLGVDPEVLDRHGAVSAAVAAEMAARGAEFTGAQYTLSITGIAGPDGGSQAKPVGTVHIGLAMRPTAMVVGTGDSQKVTVHSRRFLFTGDREDIRRRATATAMAILYFALSGRTPPDPRLLWEVG